MPITRFRLCACMRKIILSFFIFAACAGPLMTMANLTERNALPNVVNYVLNCYAEAQKNSNLVLVEKISDYDEYDQISKLGFMFDLYKPLTLPEARQLVVRLVSNLVQHINSQNKLKKYLANYPFTEKDVVIRLRLRNKDCGFIYPFIGNIAYVSALDGDIIYDTVNSFTYDLDTLRTESYSNAIKIISTSASPP